MQSAGLEVLQLWRIVYKLAIACVIPGNGPIIKPRQGITTVNLMRATTSALTDQSECSSVHLCGSKYAKAVGTVKL